MRSLLHETFGSVIMGVVDDECSVRGGCRLGEGPGWGQRASRSLGLLLDSRDFREPSECSNTFPSVWCLRRNQPLANAAIEGAAEVFEINTAGRRLSRKIVGRFWCGVQIDRSERGLVSQACRGCGLEASASQPFRDPGTCRRQSTTSAWNISHMDG